MRLDESADIFSDFWRQFQDMLSYNVHFDDDNSTPLLRTTSGGKLVGCLLSPAGGGHVLLLPEIDWSSIYPPESDADEEDEESDAEYERALQRFTFRLRDAILTLEARLHAEDSTIDSPDWLSSSQFRLAAERSIENEIADIGRQIEALSLKQEELRSALKDQTHIKSLLYAKGASLEQAVRSGLETLGFSVENFKANDSEFDVIFSADSLRYIGEVEGKDSKPINIDKSSQLQRNVSEDYSREEVDAIARGVLFANAYRTSPPTARAEYFTDKVISFAAVANMALVRTPDLFRVVRALRDRPDEDLRLRCRRAIRDGVGGIVEFPETSEPLSDIVDSSELD